MNQRAGEGLPRPPADSPAGTVESRIQAALAEARRKDADGDRPGAREIVMAILAVDERHRDARQLLATLDGMPAPGTGPRPATAASSGANPWVPIVLVAIGVVALSLLGLLYQQAAANREAAATSEPQPAPTLAPPSAADPSVAPLPATPNSSIPETVVAPASTLDTSGGGPLPERRASLTPAGAPSTPPVALDPGAIRRAERAQRLADDAGQSLGQARLAAEAARAAELAREDFARGASLEGEAGRLYARQLWLEAAEKRRAAAQAYTEAREQARVEQARLAFDEARSRAIAAGADRLAGDRFNEAASRASRAQSLRADRRFDPATRDFELAAAAMDLAQTAAAEAAAREPRPPVTAASRAPEPESRPPDAARPSAEIERAGIVTTLNRYASAMQSKDLAALKAIWPGISAAQEARVRAGFEAARSIRVQLDVLDVQIAGTSATVTCRRRDTIVTTEGQPLESDRRTVIRLVKKEAWSIAGIQ